MPSDGLSAVAPPLAVIFVFKAAEAFSSPAAERERMTLTRPGRGRNLAGMDSQVFRPMMTAFCLLGSAVVEVRSLKNLRSPGRRHGRAPSVKGIRTSSVYVRGSVYEGLVRNYV